MFEMFKTLADLTMMVCVPFIGLCVVIWVFKRLL
jgi:hypothetical protein